MTAEGIEVAGRTFRLRRLTGRVQLDLTRAQVVYADAEDVVAGLEAELEQLGARIDGLAKTDGEFDRDLRDELNRRRRELRVEQAEARGQVIRGLAGMVAARAATDDLTGDELVDWICESFEFPGDFTRLLGSGDPPTGSGTS